MPYDRLLEIGGDWAAIATAIVAVVAYGRYLHDRREKVRRLEAHLRQEKEMSPDQGLRTVLHLMRHLRMTEADILDAAFRSTMVQCRTLQDEQGHAEALLFEYDDGSDGLLASGGRARF